AGRGSPRPGSRPQRRAPGRLAPGLRHPRRRRPRPPPAGRREAGAPRSLRPSPARSGAARGAGRDPRPLCARRHRHFGWLPPGPRPPLRAQPGGRGRPPRRAADPARGPPRRCGTGPRRRRGLRDPLRRAPGASSGVASRLPPAWMADEPDRRDPGGGGDPPPRCPRRRGAAAGPARMGAFRMSPERIRALLEKVGSGELSAEEAMEALRDLPFADLGYASVDHHRNLRQGFPEAVYAEGKTAEQIAGIACEIAAKGSPLLVTRLDVSRLKPLRSLLPEGKYDAHTRTFRLQSSDS